MKIPLLRNRRKGNQWGKEGWMKIQSFTLNTYELKIIRRALKEIFVKLKNFVRREKKKMKKLGKENNFGFKLI